MVEIAVLERHHLEKLRYWRNQQAVWQNFTNPLMINEEEQEAWFKQQSLDPAKQYYAVMNEGEFVGSVWMDEWDKINRSCRVGIFIVPHAQRMGIGQEALGGFIRYLLEDVGIHRIWLLVIDDNKPAIGLYKKLGFKEEGRQKEAIFRGGKWHDYIMYSLLEDEKSRHVSSIRK